MNDDTALAIKKHLETIEKETAAVRNLLNEAGQKELVLEGGKEGAGKTQYLPQGWTRMSKAEQKARTVLANSPSMILIGDWFNRRETTLWTVFEAVLLKNINPTPEAIKGMGVYYSANIPKAEDFRRRDLPTLLGNWHSELDRARAYVKSIQ